MVAIRQTSFAGGEWDPRLHQRPDLDKYATALKLGLNFFVSRQGQLWTRAGTEFATRTKLSNVFPPQVPSPARILPFLVSDELAYVLEFGEGYVRIVKDGAAVTSGGSPVEVSTPYTYDDLAELKHVQSGDVLTLVHGNYPPATLTRNSETSWAYATISFDRPGVLFPTLGSGHDAVVLDADQLASSAIDAAHPGVASRWVYTQLLRNPDGTYTETSARPITHTGKADGSTYTAINTGDLYACYQDRAQRISIVARATGAAYYRIYRGQGATYGWVGDCDGYIFFDKGDAPDYTQQPPKGLNPFNVLNEDGSVNHVEYPRTVTYFEDRLVFGGTLKIDGTPGRPADVLGSSTSDYYNFDSRNFPIESEAVDFTLASRKREEIRSLVPLQKLLIQTNSNVWAMGGTNGPLAFDNVDCKVQIEVGANWVDPVVVDGVALFARTMGTGVRALGYDIASQSYENRDVSILASHLFDGHTVVDMAYCEDPWDIVWVLRDDGVLLSFTYVKAQDVWAWAQHDFGGPVRSICSIPENGEHVLYMVVDRGFGLFSEQWTIERMKSRKLDFAKDDAGNFTAQPWCLDGAKSFQTADLASIANLSHLSQGTEVMALADGVVYGPYTLDRLGTIPASALDPKLIASKQIIIGIPHNCDMQQLEPVVPGKETSINQKTVDRVWVDVYATATFDAGPDFDHLKTWKSRLVSDGYGPIQARTERAPIFLQSGWSSDATVCIRISEPLPATILGIIREVSFGGT